MNNRQKLVQKQFLNNEEAVIKRLNQIYGQSLTDINGKIKNLTFTIDKLQKEYDWMDPDDPEKARVKSIIQSKIYQKQYQEQLQKQIDGILNQMQNKSYLTVSDYLDECYTDGFIGTVFDAHGQGIPIISPINQEAMVRAVQLESKISKGLYTRLGEDVTLLKKKITAQVSRSIATGMTYAQTAKQLEGYTRIGYNKAVRIARTEGHRIQTTATMDAMENAKDKGADVVKQWDATLDGDTRDSHRVVDGEIRELDKPFSNGLMYPGDPSGGAAEVVNCRCALLQRARWALDEGELQTLQDRAKFYGLDKSDQFEDFKKKYLKASDDLQKIEKINNSANIAKQTNATIKKTSNFVPAQTLEEADEWLKQHGIQGYYAEDEINLDVANLINKNIDEYQGTFGDYVRVRSIQKYPKSDAPFVAAYAQSSGDIFLHDVSDENALQRLAEEALEQFQFGGWSTGNVAQFIRHELGHAVHSGIGKSNVSEAMTSLFNQATAGLEWGKYGFNWDAYEAKGLSFEKYQSDVAEAGKILSAYGFNSVEEMVAESIAEYMNGNPREFAKKVVETLLGR